MAENPSAPGDMPPEARFAGGSAAAAFSTPEIPPSKLLQWFLLFALVVTVGAYLADQGTRFYSNQTKILSGSRLRRMAHCQIDYLAHCQAGNAALAARHYDQAVTEFTQALQSENTGTAHQNLGQALLKTLNPEAAFAQFQQALAIDPSLVSVYSAWGEALSAQGKPEEASHILGQGVSHNPSSGLLHYDLATTLLQIQINAEGRRRVAVAAGHPQEAAAAATEAKSFAAAALLHFKSASRHGVDSAAFWRGYGQLLNQLGQFAEAEPCLLRAVAKEDNDATAHFQLASTEYHLGKYAEAIAHYEKVLTLTPDDPTTLNSLALLYATATNSDVRTPKMAVQLASRASSATTDQNAGYMDTLARSYAADGDFFQAITWEDKAIHRATQLNDLDLKKELEARYALLLDHKTP